MRFFLINQGLNLIDKLIKYSLKINWRSSKSEIIRVEPKLTKFDQMFIFSSYSVYEVTCMCLCVMGECHVCTLHNCVESSS